MAKNPDIVILNIPYTERHRAKRRGAYYDWRTKTWYAYKNMSHFEDRFGRWLNEEQKAELFA